ncbi:hypothetical protein [Paenibacillus sp. XY044]|uniref:hypothetical protein n=1 Tax=Paenibacillus sp. XY044 TaxID=2026089 RepID=UPI000B994476|nr:hypothetical protein [Paenibacillus sp. XY044]OZB98008.1 hypothetical protein CJP46_02255 [Paenibacillus sp. XY044]
MNESNGKEYVYKLISEIVRTEIRNLGLLSGEWHLGTVDSIVSTKKINVFIDGSTSSQTIPCNPDVAFKPGDHIYVIFVNGDSKDKFALCKRGI